MAQGRAYFFNDGIKAEIGIDINGVKWNTAVGNKGKTFSDSDSDDNRKNKKHFRLSDERIMTCTCTETESRPFTKRRT